jgi:S2P endopeptidase
VSVHSVGVSLTLVIPAAFVALDSNAMRLARQSDQLRIIAAGAWHNLLLYGACSTAAWLDVYDGIYSLLGYRDVSSLGLVVVGLEEVS